jgi:hypothetical protein
MGARLSGDGDRGRAIDDGLRQSVLGARSVLDFQCARFEIHGMMSQGGSHRLMIKLARAVHHAHERGILQKMSCAGLETSLDVIIRSELLRIMGAALW